MADERRIMLIGVVPANERTRAAAPELTEAVGPGWRVEVRSPKRGAGHVEYGYYEALMLVELLHLVKQADREGYDGAVINCFYDPGLREAREVAERVVVTAPCEACVLTAASLGHRFSILVGRRKWVPQMYDTVLRYGLKDRLASFKTLEMGVPDFHKDHAETVRRMRQAAREAVEADGAEVLILGCTATRGFYRELQAELGVPVLDPVLTPLMHCRYLVELRDRFGWYTSKVGGYETPARQEMEAFRLGEQFPGHARAWK